MDSADPAGRARALQEIAGLARQHGLSLSDIAAVLGQPAEPPHENRLRGILVRVLGFLGGTFVFAGIGVFIALQWDEMNSAARVIVTLGSGFVTFVLGILAAKDPRFEKAGTPLLLMAAALEPTGMLVAFSEYGSGGDWRWASLITCGTMALQFGAVFGMLRRSTPLFMTMLFTTLFFWTALDLLDADKTVVALLIGGSMLLAAIGIDRTGHRDITPVWYLLGASLFMYGVFDGVEDTPFEIMFLAVAAGLVYLSVAVHSRTLLFVSTLGILSYTGYFTRQHFADSVGWPIALIAFGIFMIGLSALAMRIDRLYVRGAGTSQG
jgi:hypothetical protein